MRQGPSCCRFFRLLPFAHNAPFQFQQERVKHGRLHNLKNPSILALLCGLADRQQEGKSAATVFIQPGASCCVVGCFVFCHFAHSVLHHCSCRVCPRLWWSLTAVALASARWAFFSSALVCWKWKSESQTLLLLFLPHSLSKKQHQTGCLFVVALCTGPGIVCGPLKLQIHPSKHEKNILKVRN